MNSFGGQELYIVEKAFADLSDLDHQGNSIWKIGRHSRVAKSLVTQKTRSV